MRLYNSNGDSIEIDDTEVENISDGYHTFKELYYHRAVLFATIVNAYKDYAWKSVRHSDGKRCFDSDNWFIVGIETPEGRYTYHYEMKYWDLFNCIEIEKAPQWDGHRPEDVTRLLSLAKIKRG